MKNKQEIFGLVINVLLVVFLFCFIVVGLNLIGIYSLPAQIEKILGTFKGNDNQLSGDNSSNYSDTSFSENEFMFESVELDYENAYAILSALSPRSDYSQKVKVVHSYNGKSRDEYFDIYRNENRYSVAISDENGNLVKRISEDSEQLVSIYENYDENHMPAVVRKGNFDIAEECGFVLTATEFLESGYDLSEAEFFQMNTDDGVYVSVEFDTTYNNLTSRQKYVISLDFGVVTEVYSYENGVAVYQMTTTSISENV